MVLLCVYSTTSFYIYILYIYICTLIYLFECQPVRLSQSLSLSRFFFFTSYTSFPLLLPFTGVAPWLPFPPTDDDHDTNAVGAHTQTDTEPTPVPQPRTQCFVHLFQSIPIPANDDQSVVHCASIIVKLSIRRFLPCYS